MDPKASVLPTTPQRGVKEPKWMRGSSDDARAKKLIVIVLGFAVINAS